MRHIYCDGLRIGFYSLKNMKIAFEISLESESERTMRNEMKQKTCSVLPYFNYLTELIEYILTESGGDSKSVSEVCVALPKICHLS